MADPVVCTIVSNNYLAFARVLAHSLLDQHPETQLYVLIVDEPAESIDYSAERFQVVYAHELGIPAFEHFSFKYSLLELNTAVKPYFLTFLHRQFGARSAVYFDPDIKICGELTPLFEQLQTSNLLLTPHLLEPLEDEKRPSERTILLSGVYNLGFLGIRFNDETLEFLDWWQRRLYSHCLHRVADGLFVDQRWMDLAPSYLSEVHILRDPGYNMAYWTLANRHLTRESGEWRVNGRPLRFFHFSGFVTDDLEQISKYQDRFKLQDRPDLRPLMADYRENLLQAGNQKARNITYAYGRFRNGVSSPEVARGELWRQDSSGDRWSDPFDVQTPDSYHSWLSGTVESEDVKASLPRIALILWENRQDLQRVFPSPMGVDHEEYVHWIVSGGPETSGIDPVWYADLVDSHQEKRVQLRPSKGGKPRVDDAGTSHLDLATIDLQALGADAGLDAEQRPLIPRMAMLIWEERHDVHEAFQAPLGQSRKAFARWYTTFASLEYGIPEELVMPTLHSMPVGDRLYAQTWRQLAVRGHVRFIPQGSWRQFAFPTTPPTMDK